MPAHFRMPVLISTIPIQFSTNMTEKGKNGVKCLAPYLSHGRPGGVPAFWLHLCPALFTLTIYRGNQISLFLSFSEFQARKGVNAYTIRRDQLINNNKIQWIHTEFIHGNEPNSILPSLKCYIDFSCYYF